MPSRSEYPTEVLRGALLRSLSDARAEFIPDALVLLDGEGPQAGRVQAMGPAKEIADANGLNLDDMPVTPGLWMPAFFDTHFHWVQDDVREMPKASLIEWLNLYTFPEEARYGEREFARRKAEFFWERILKVGTVGGLCYSSIHEVALEEALKLAPEDFRIGNVLMTMECPEIVCQTEAEAIASVRACAERFGDRYVCSPRFAPTTAPEVMRAAAEAAKAGGCFQQTHLDETIPEIEWVLGIYRQLPGFEDVESYTDIYARVGMLGPQTVFGHCIHVSEREWQLLADSGSKIASCPTSNAPINQLGLGSGLFDFRQAEAYGVPWALASDIGGGPYLSMFDVMHSFVSQNRAAGRAEATYTKALHRSTRKGAELMNLGADRGLLEEGCYFDAIRVPLPEGEFRVSEAEKVLEAMMTQMPNRAATDDFVLETRIRGEVRFLKEAQRCG